MLRLTYVIYRIKLCPC